MKKTFYKVFGDIKSVSLFTRLHLVMIKRYAIFLLLAFVMNPIVMFTLGNLLLKQRPSFRPITQSSVVEYTELNIFFAPDHPILVNMFHGLHFPLPPKGYKNSTNFLSRLKSLSKKSHSILNYDLTYVGLLENVSLKSVTAINMTDRTFHVTNITFSSYFAGRYGLEVHFSRDLKSIYLSHIYVLTRAMFTMYPNEIMPEITLTGLPNSLYYEIVWPAMQMFFNYVTFGVVILHLKYIRRLSRRSIVPQKGMSVIVNYGTVLVIYNVFALIIYGFICRMLTTDYFKSHFVKYLSWHRLLIIFLTNFNTTMLLAFVVCEFNMATYNMMYFCGIVMAPQVLFVYTFSQSNGLHCYFQLMTCLSPLFAVGLSLVSIEHREAEVRLFNVEITLHDEFKFKCFSFYLVFYIQLAHMCFCGLIIIYKNFFSTIFSFRKYRTFQFENLKKQTRRVHKKATSVISPKGKKPLIAARKLDLKKISEKCVRKGYIMYLYKVYKSFKIQGKIKPVINGVTGKFKRNRVTTILGPNGSGKTTLLQLMSGIQTATMGHIFINGINLSENPQKALKYIQKYIDEITIFNFLTMSEYFELVIFKNCDGNYNSIQQRLKNFIVLCQIETYMQLTLRVCPYSVIRVMKIICTFLTDRPIILLDDPMEGLDYILMQNVCALFADQKFNKTIIFTSCDSNIVEYLTDSVVVLIHGKKVSQTYIENFNIEEMVYRLIFSMKLGCSDYSLIKFIKTNFSRIKHEESIGRLVYFSVPKLSLDDLWFLLEKLEISCERLGVWKYKINPISIRHFLSYSYDKYMKKKNYKIMNYFNETIVPENIRDTSVIYKRHFILFFQQRIIYYTRYPNRFIMRFLIPLLVLLIWSASTSLSHPTIFTIDHGYFQPSYIEEIQPEHQVYIGCDGESANCAGLFSIIKPHLDFMTVVNEIQFPHSNNDFQKFQNYLYAESESDFLNYGNRTLFCIFFVMKEDNPVTATVMANDYESKIFAFSLAGNVLMSPKVVTLTKFLRFDFEVTTQYIDINFLFRLIIIILLAFSMTTHRYIAQPNHQQFFMIHKLADVHYSILHVPLYMIDLFHYCLIICFMILILYLMQDHNITSIAGSITEVVSVFFLFAMADLAFKSLIDHVTGYHNLTVFAFACIDLFIVLYLNVLYMVNFVMKIQEYSYIGVKLDDEKFFAVTFILKLFFPSANLNSGLKSMESKQETSANGILFLQWVFYFSLLMLYNSHEYEINYFCKKLQVYKEKVIEPKLKNLNNPKSFLFLKNITLLKHKKMYYTNLTNEFKEGSVWGIIGRNDTGKSDLLNIIIGKSVPTAGGVYLRGSLCKNFVTKNKNIKVGHSSEKLFFVPDLSVEETLIYWCRLKLLPEYLLRGAVTEILNVLLLLHEMSYCVKTLSKSSIKKLDIALAIIGFPELIILDDPLSSLDSLSRLGVMKLIRKAKEHNSTVIISAREMLDLRNIVTHLLIISDRKVCYQGGLIHGICSSKLGYYLTIFRHLDEVDETQSSDLTTLIGISFKDSTLFKTYVSHVVYFLPFQDVNEPNTTKILIFMETVKLVYNYQRYFIRYDAYHSNET